MRQPRGKNTARALNMEIIRANFSDRAIAQFLLRIDPPNERGCRLYRGARAGAFGHGRVSAKRDGRVVMVQMAHRFAFVLQGGVLEDGDDLLHFCDVPNCLAFEHLHVGDQRQNVAEMWERGRGNPRGAWTGRPNESRIVQPRRSAWPATA